VYAKLRAYSLVNDRWLVRQQIQVTKQRDRYFVKGYGGSFTRAVVNHLDHREVSSRGGDRHDMAVVAFRHSREKLSNSRKRGECIDGKGRLYIAYLAVGDGETATYPGVVYCRVKSLATSKTKSAGICNL
jgi:hypothetical protein